LIGNAFGMGVWLCDTLWFSATFGDVVSYDDIVHAYKLFTYNKQYLNLEV